MPQHSLDEAIDAYYTHQFDEGARLTTRSAQGRLEFERTQQIIRRHTPAPAKILDVGGATGVHAAALAHEGYEVTLIDPVASQVEAARQHGTFRALVGDARDLSHFADDTFDAVLMAGPLYHLSDKQERAQALREAVRVCRSGGYIHAAAIPRFLAFAAAALRLELLDSAPSQWLDLLREGTPPSSLRFPAGHFHTPEELTDEMAEAGLENVTVIGLEGPAGIALETPQEIEEADYAAAARLAQTFDDSTLVRNLSCHILGTGRTP